MTISNANSVTTTGIETWMLYATWAAALVALISVLVTLWVRYRDRPSAQWYFGQDMVISAPSHFYSKGNPPHAFYSLTNIGDGSAHGLQVTASKDTEARFFQANSSDARGFSFLPIHGMVTPNETISIAVWVHTEERDGSQVLPSGEGFLTFSWTESPTRHKRHRLQTFRFLGEKLGPGEIKRQRNKSRKDTLNQNQ